MNSIAGGTVYFGGEMTVQIQSQIQNKSRNMETNNNSTQNNWGNSLHKADWGKAVSSHRNGQYFNSINKFYAFKAKLGALGSVENGMIMLYW